MEHDNYPQEGSATQISPAKKKFILIEADKKKINRFLLILWLVSTVFLFLRILLESLGSDPRSLFAAFIYIISGIFLLPFFGIFPNSENTMQPGISTFDEPAFVCIVCYTILILLAVALTYILTKMLKTEKQVDETVRKNNPIDMNEASTKVI